MAAAADIELEAAHARFKVLKRHGDPHIGRGIIRVVVVRVIRRRIAIVRVFDF
ncbi:hypothetical protein D3C85_1798720 [compost metagenome]